MKYIIFVIIGLLIISGITYGYWQFSQRTTVSDKPVLSNFEELTDVDPQEVWSIGGDEVLEELEVRYNQGGLEEVVKYVDETFVPGLMIKRKGRREVSVVADRMLYNLAPDGKTTTPILGSLTEVDNNQHDFIFVTSLPYLKEPFQLEVYQRVQE